MADTTISIEQLQEKILKMKKALLDWEKSFELRYNRRPTIADVQKRPDRGNAF